MAGIVRPGHRLPGAVSWTIAWAEASSPGLNLCRDRHIGHGTGAAAQRARLPFISRKGVLAPTA